MVDTHADISPSVNYETGSLENDPHQPEGIEWITSILIAILTLVAACAESRQETELHRRERRDRRHHHDAAPAALRAEIDAANDAFKEGMAAGGDSGPRAVYTQDAVLYPPDSEPVEGIDAVPEFWAGYEEQVGTIESPRRTILANRIRGTG